MVDADTGRWDAELSSIGDVDPTMQAELGWAGRTIAPLSPQVAAAPVCPADTLVVAGGGDQPCACLGMGMLAPRPGCVGHRHCVGDHGRDASLVALSGVPPRRWI